MRLELAIADTITLPPQSDRANAVRDDDALISELALTSAATSVRVGRQFAARTLTEWDVPPEPIQDAVLIVSELLTNAIRHGRPPIMLRLLKDSDKDSDEVAIEVDDSDESTPYRRTAHPDAAGGRGLSIVEALSRRWYADVSGSGSGKTVRSVLAI